MKLITIILFFLLVYHFPNANAQNLSQAISVQQKTIPIAQNSSSETENDPTLVSVEVLGLRKGSFFKNPSLTKTPKTFLERAGDLYKEGLFQRRRFDETGQPIEMEANHLYYRRDSTSYTKGIILYKFFDGRMDFGIYRRNFAPATTLLSGKLSPDFGQGDSNAVLFRNGSKVFFSLRVNLSK